MIARELITNDVPPIRSSETVEKALNWLDEFKVNHLAVVDGVEYQGLISENILYDAVSSDITIAELNLTLNRPFIYEDRHIYEVMKMVSEMQLSIAPILDKSDNYLGLTTLPSLMHLIANTASISEPGSVIILELNQNDYSLGHLAQVIEGDDTKILSTYITSANDSTLMEVTIKVNRKNIQGVLQALARYDYVVNASYSEIDYQEDMKDRFESLMKYLDM